MLVDALIRVACWLLVVVFRCVWLVAFCVLGFARDVCCVCRLPFLCVVGFVALCLFARLLSVVVSCVRFRRAASFVATRWLCIVRCALCVGGCALCIVCCVFVNY